MFKGIKSIQQKFLATYITRSLAPSSEPEEGGPSTPAPLPFITAPGSPSAPSEHEEQSIASSDTSRQGKSIFTMGNESRPDIVSRGSQEPLDTLNLVDPNPIQSKAGSEFGGQSNAGTNKPEQTPAEAAQEAVTKAEQENPEITEEEKQKIRDEEERTKAIKRMAQIVDKGLDKVKPLLEMIDQTIDEANKKKENNELDEDAFVSKMKPLIENAHGVMQSTLDQIKALDPDNKFERFAKRNVEDAQATPEEKLLIDGCNELGTRVKATIDKGRTAIEGMPKAKKELGPLFNLLSEPLLQILGAVGLLVAGVLNLLANILNALGLGGALTQVLQGLRLDKLLSSMGYTVGASKK